MRKLLIDLFYEDNGKLSLGRTWAMFLLCVSCYFWFMGMDIPSTMFQVLMLLLSYVTMTKAIGTSGSIGNTWMNYKFGKDYQKGSSQAAKQDNVDDVLGGK